MPTALVANPNAAVVDHGDRRWLLFGTHQRELRTRIEQGANFDAVRDLETSLPGEGTIVVLSEGADEPTIRAHRGITSAYEVFYGLDSSGEPIVTDLFKNAIARLEPEDRIVPDRAVADHLLYRTTPIDTYVDRLHRLDHGETLTWTPGQTTPRTELTETLEPDPTVTPDNAVDRLDEILSAICDPIAGDATLMLSGGVDSTVLNPYLSEPTDSVSATFDTPELEFEADYARDAAELVDTDHEFVEMTEANYLQRLESAVDALGMPPHQLQTPTFDGLYRDVEDRTLVSGQVADAVFGLTGTLERGRKVWRTRHLKHVPSLVEPLRQHGTVLEKLEASPSDPDGQALQFAAYTHVPSAVETIGRREYERRQLARYEYTTARVPPASGSNYAEHMHLGHWTDFFCEDAVTIWRQQGLARGREMYTPFAGKAVAELALGLAASERYVDGDMSKHLPKKLLERKYPNYDLQKPKGNGNFPADRFVTSGPLGDIFDRYELPGFVPDSVARDLEAQPGLAWNLAGYAIWRDRVLRSDELSLAPHTRIVSVASDVTAPAVGGNR